MNEIVLKDMPDAFSVVPACTAFGLECLGDDLQGAARAIIDCQICGESFHTSCKVEFLIEEQEVMNTGPYMTGIHSRHCMRSECTSMEALFHPVVSLLPQAVESPGVITDPMLCDVRPMLQGGKDKVGDAVRRDAGQRAQEPDDDDFELPVPRSQTPSAVASVVSAPKNTTITNRGTQLPPKTTPEYRALEVAVVKAAFSLNNEDVESNIFKKGKIEASKKALFERVVGGYDGGLFKKGVDTQGKPVYYSMHQVWTGLLGGAINAVRELRKDDFYTTGTTDGASTHDLQCLGLMEAWDRAKTKQTTEPAAVMSAALKKKSAPPAARPKKTEEEKKKAAAQKRRVKELVAQYKTDMTAYMSMQQGAITAQDIAHVIGNMENISLSDTSLLKTELDMSHEGGVFPFNIRTPAISVDTSDDDDGRAGVSSRPTNVATPEKGRRPLRTPKSSPHKNSPGVSRGTKRVRRHEMTGAACSTPKDNDMEGAVMNGLGIASAQLSDMAKRMEKDRQQVTAHLAAAKTGNKSDALEKEQLATARALTTKAQLDNLETLVRMKVLTQEDFCIRALKLVDLQ